MSIGYYRVRIGIVQVQDRIGSCRYGIVQVRDHVGTGLYWYRYGIL